MRQGRLYFCALLVGMLSSAAVAGGPFGAPMSTLNPGQWAVDGGYWHEEADMDGSAVMTEYWRGWSGNAIDDPNGVWTDWYLDGNWDQKVSVDDLETDTYVGSVEYGLFENMDVYVRLGATSTEGDVIFRGWDVDYEDVNEAYVLVVDPWEHKYSVDFGSGFTWQVGTRFTICKSGPWTWGGRLHFAMADGGTGDVCFTEEEYWEGDEYTGVDVYTTDAEVDLEWWQAVAYIGPTYQLSDAFQVYIAGGWQTMNGTAKFESTDTWDGYTVSEGEGGEERSWYSREQDSYEGTFKLEHASAIAVFGAAWAPTEQINIGVDALIGESGKWGIGVTGAYAF